MSIAQFAVEKKLVTYFAALLLVLGGVAAFDSLGQLEDPNFTVKDAKIITQYPGASPAEVELEVTDRIETKLQELKQLKFVESSSWDGTSEIKLQILPNYWSDKLPQVWDEMRRRVREVEAELPPGAGRPQIFDDFGDVYGFQLAVVGDGFSPAQLEEFTKALRKELVLVKGVARADLWGVQPKVIYLDVRQSQLAQLGLSDESIENTLQQQNMVVDAGKVNLQSKRFRIAPTGAFRSPEDIGDLIVRPTLTDSLQSTHRGKETSTGYELIRIRDIGTIRRGHAEPPPALMRYNGVPAIGISITNRPGVNIVTVGQAIDEKLEELVPLMPVGIEVFRVHWQSDIVDAAVDSFVTNFIEAVLIVLVVLTLFMGWRMGLIIGCGLVATVLGTFIVMSIMGIDLHRMSLGALVIALGMMVDNSIVVADGAAVRMQQGMDRVKAAVEAASKPAMPLLGATVIAVMAFFPISASPESTGEYCQALMIVVAISLIISWVVSLTLTPVQCIDMLPEPKKGAQADPYGGGFYRKYRQLLIGAMRYRVFTLGGMVALLVVSFIGFGQVTQMFFPASSMTKFMIDFRAPQSTRIETLGEQLRLAEKKLMADERVESVASFVGQGPPRFYLPVEPEDPNGSYAQLVVNVKDFKEIDAIMADLEPWFKETYPDFLIPLRKYDVGPSKTWKFEIRVSGPAVADPGVLRNLAGEFISVLEQSPLTAYSRTDWVERVQKVVPEYSQERGRWSAVTRDDIARASKRAFDGRQVGLYRERDHLIPIVLRHVEEERRNLNGLPLLQVRPPLATDPIPLAQVTRGIVTQWEDPTIRRRDRRRAVKVQANPIPGATLPELRNDVLAQLEAIKMPPGYRWDWGGEWEDTVDSQTALIPGVIPMIAVMLLILVALYNQVRPPLIIVLTVPFAIIGVTWSLLLTNTPFGFMALLGGMSLIGMMMKNAIVLFDQVEEELKEGKDRYQAMIDAAISRVRPVALAAATTVLGVIPLLQDVFWVAMAATIMGGLAFGTILTMVLAPTLYATLYNLKIPDEPSTAAAAPATA